MTGRSLPEGRYGFGALEVGDRIDVGSVEVSADTIDAFAALTGDRFAIHMEDAAAQAKGFPRRVAHGLLVLSLVDGLKNQAAAQFDAIASLGWDWRFQKPVFLGDMISAHIDVVEKRATSDPRRGILTLKVTVRNQRDEIVQQGENLLMVER